MDVYHLQEIGLLNHRPCLNPSAVDATGNGVSCKSKPAEHNLLPEPIRDARSIAPQIFAARWHRKEGKASKLVFGKTSELFPSVFEATVAAWTSELKLNMKEKALRLAGDRKQWSEYCRQQVTSFSLGIATSAGSQEMIAHGDEEAIQRAVRGYLERKLKPENRAYLERAALHGNVVPLWQAEASVPDPTDIAFDCMIVEPFNPDWDPTFTLESVGMQKIGAAVLRLDQLLSTSNYARIEALLKDLERITNLQQVVLRSIQERVQDWVSEVLRSILEKRGLSLHSLVPFGSAELGTATVASDIDFAAFVHTSESAQALLQHVITELEQSPPSWLRAGTLVAVLQTSRVPTISFEVNLREYCILPNALELAEVLEALGIPVRPECKMKRISVDVSFNNNFAALEARFYKALLGHNGIVLRLLIWLKYWTQFEDINNPHPGCGSLSSSGWRMLVLAILMEQGVVPCLREGFELAVNPPCMHGLNVWWDAESAFQHVTEMDVVPLLQIIAGELKSCVGSNSMRIFQLVTRRTDCLDEIIGQMSVAGNIRIDILQAVERLPSRVRLLICDVDGVLFQISNEMRSKALEDTGEFFFNTEDSVPATVAPRVFDFVHKAELCGFSVAVVSGRDEKILHQVSKVIEQRQRGEQLQPFLYIFKPRGSRSLTVEHKMEMMSQILQCCKDSDKVIDTLGIVDDMEPHMAAFLKGAEPFNVPKFALNAFETSAREIQLRHHNPTQKHMIILALPHGSDKMNIFHRLQSKLPNAQLVIWDSSDADWDRFVGRVLDAMNAPGAKYILVKIAPDLDKAGKLALFVRHSGSIFCMHQPICAESDLNNQPDQWSTSARLQLVAQFSAVLHGNQERQQIGGSGLYVATSEEYALWPNEVGSYNDWVEKIWYPEPGGIVSAFQRLSAKALKCRKIVRDSGKVSCLRCVPFEFYSDAPDLTRGEVEQLNTLCGADGKAGLLNSKGAARKRRAEVIAAMQQVHAVTGVVRTAQNLRLDPSYVAQQLAEKISQLTETPSSMLAAACLDSELQSFVN